MLRAPMLSAGCDPAAVQGTGRLTALTRAPLLHHRLTKPGTCDRHAPEPKDGFYTISAKV